MLDFVGNLLGLLILLAVIAAVVIGINYVRRPEWTKRKLAGLADRLKGKQ